MLEFWIDPNSQYFKQGKLDLKKEMVLFCAAGARSALAAKSLQDMGFKKYLILKVDLPLLNRANLKSCNQNYAYLYIPFLILILIVVFIHEYGHYYFAKKYGVGITDFSIGFGKEIFGWNDKSGTRWKICWIPLGGYVKFFGDRNVYSQSDHEEILKNILKRNKKNYLL